MIESIAPIVALLKAARQKQGLTQHALAGKIGVPQSHISKIESGAVDLQTSSLVQMARALAMEVMLVPREAVPAVAVFQRDAEAKRDPDEQIPAYNLDDDNG